MSMRRRIGAMLIAGLATLLAACGGDKAASSKSRVDGQEITFGILRTENAENLRELWDPFIADMEAQTGLKVKPYYSTDYAALVEALRFNQVQVAWLSNKPGMEAVDRADVEVFARTVKAGQVKGYYSLVVVPAKSPIKSIDQLLQCGKRYNFGIGDINSTSGYLVPSLYLFAPRGIEPADCFKTVRSGDHEVNSMAIIANQLDAAIIADSQIERLQVTRPQDVAKIREIWRSPMIPNDPMVWQNDLDPDVKARVMKFFMAYGRMGAPAEVARQRKILFDLQWDPFEPSSNAHLYVVRDLQARRDLADAGHDKTLSAAERTKRVAEAKAKIDELAKLMKEQPEL